MVAANWNWGSLFMASTFGWKSALAVVINATLASALLARALREAPPAAVADEGPRVPLTVRLVHLAFLVCVVLGAHHAEVFFGLFLFSWASPRRTRATSNRCW